MAKQRIRRLLVANRGEIAVRIMRSAREMGIKTIAVFSEADRAAWHVQCADEAFLLGPAPPLQSYLDAKKIIALCRKHKADAIHPGYGFLSENAGFARSVIRAGILFIGPSPRAIKTMGDKLEAKAAVSRYNIPMVPGSGKALTGLKEAERVAAAIKYPVLIKAAAGGGGKGMRVVNSKKELAGGYERASSEAMEAFGDPSVFLEKYIPSPRHIEVQVMGDRHGNIVHLLERECSIQRRHQKVIEESPSPIITPELRSRIGESAVDVARSCGYYGAGTVEFLVDAGSKGANFYFLEMNTRLQVEHPVTEMITGIDLVREQIRVAEGEKLSFTQEDISGRGHAIELRVYAEDPKNGFLPDAGVLSTHRIPSGPGIRVDAGYAEGLEVPVYYDPLISKLIAHGRTRGETIERMKRAIAEYEISGVKNTLAFGRFVMEHPAFISGDIDTRFIGKHFTGEMMGASEEGAYIAAALGGFIRNTVKSSPAPMPDINPSKWRERTNLRGVDN